MSCMNSYLAERLSLQEITVLFSDVKLFIFKTKSIIFRNLIHLVWLTKESPTLGWLGLPETAKRRCSTCGGSAEASCCRLRAKQSAASRLRSHGTKRLGRLTKEAASLGWLACAETTKASVSSRGSRCAKQPANGRRLGRGCAEASERWRGRGRRGTKERLLLPKHST